MVSQATKVNRLILGPDLLDSSDAAREMGVQPDHLTRDIRPLIAHCSRSLQGKGGRGVGYAYLKKDVQRVRLIMRATGTGALRAAQTLFAIRQLYDKGILDQIAIPAAISVLTIQKGRDSEN